MKAAYAGVAAYKQNQFNTADRGTILLMLYQGAIDFLDKAKEHLEKGEISEKGTCLSKAHAIITELLTTLNFEVGGDIARQLESLYHFMLDQLMQAHLSNDSRPILAVLPLLHTLKEAWEVAVAQVRREGLNP